MVERNKIYLMDCLEWEEIHRGSLFKIDIKILLNNMSRYVEKLNEKLEKSDISEL